MIIVATPWAVRSQGSKPSVNRSGVPSNGAATQGIEKRWNEFGIWGGISLHIRDLEGRTSDAKFGTVGLRYGRVLLASKYLAFEWTIDAIPLAILSNTRTAPTQRRESVYAWGVTPVGLKFNFRRQHRVQPFFAAGAGFLDFSSDIPVDGAAQFNFTEEGGGGVQIVNGSRRAFMIGYKYQHISNASRSPINPGVDMQMIYAGFSIFR